MSVVVPVAFANPMFDFFLVFNIEVWVIYLGKRKRARKALGPFARIQVGLALGSCYRFAKKSRFICLLRTPPTLFPLMEF